MNDPIAPAPAAPKTPRRWLTGVALAAAFVAGGITAPLLAASAQEAGMHAMMGGPGGMHARMMAHLDRALDAAGASADQKAKITAILRAGFAPMADMHAGMSATHASLHAILLAPTIDRAALERLRAGQIAKIDAASKTMVNAMADAAEVLTPAQRAKLAAMPMDHRPPS